MPNFVNHETPQTGTKLHDKIIRTGLSTLISINVNPFTKHRSQIGLIQRMQVSEVRELRRIYEAGNDGVVEIVPINAGTVNLTCSRIVYNKARILEAFARGFQHIHSQRIPFDISIEHEDGSNWNKDGRKITEFQNCWFQNYDVTYEENNYIITENAQIWAERSFDTIEKAKETRDAEVRDINGKNILIDPFEYKHSAAEGFRSHPGAIGEHEIVELIQRVVAKATNYEASIPASAISTVAYSV